MEKTKPKSSLRVFAALMAFVLALGLAPMLAFAGEDDGSPALVVADVDNGPTAESIDVYVTVSNKGTLALARQLVTVTDADADGKLTLDDAMKAVHEQFCPGGYASGQSGDYYTVTKLWGVETTNTTFYINDEITSSVDAQAVEAGNEIVASVLSDDAYYSDHYAFFDKKTATVQAGADLELVLSAKTWDEPMAAPGVQIGTWQEGAFSPIEGKSTGVDGSVTLSFDEPGTYVVSASGVVFDEVTIDWTTYATEMMNCPLTAPVCVVTVNPENAEPADVYVTISNKGTLALAHQLVTVTDADADGKLTLDDAMKAVHEQFCPGGYASGQSGDYYTVTKLWGVETTNTTFYIDDKITSSVDAQAVEAGNDIVANVNSDNTYWSDHYAFFDKKTATVVAGANLTLILKAKTWEDPIAAPGVQVGTWASGKFTPLEGKTTDNNGKVALSFSKPGTYIVSANGTVSDKVQTSYVEPYTFETMDCPLTAPFCIVTATAGPVVDLSKAVVTLSQESSVYNGKAQKGAVKSVTLNGKQLVAGTDYDVTATSGTNVGSYDVIVKGKGGYTGTVKATFKITAASIAKAELTLTKASSAYTGKAQKGSLKRVTLNGKTLNSNDFTVSAKSGKNVGSYVVEVKGKGNYTGTAKTTFKITKAKAKIKKKIKKSLKASKLNNKEYKFTAFKLTTDGTKIYKVVKADKTNHLTFKSGKVFVKNDTPKGTYIMKVKVSAKAGKNYNKLKAKTYTIKVIVKK